MALIIVDSRSGSGELLSLFPKGIAKLNHLEYGDMCWIGNGPDGSVLSVGVERKAILDLINSMSTGRIAAHQLPGLRAQYDIIYIIVEGVWRGNPKSGILELARGSGHWMEPNLGRRRFMARDVWCFLSTITTIAGAIVIRTSNRQDTVQCVTSLHHWWTAKEWGEHRSHLALQQCPEHGQLVQPSLVRRVAAQLPGIGWKKSQAVEREFKTVVDMVMASEHDWTKIEGVGKGIAGNVVKAIYDSGRYK